MFYVGKNVKSGVNEVFTSVSMPDEVNFPQYNCCIGPFSSEKAAKAMLHYGTPANPNMLTVEDAEKAAIEDCGELDEYPLYQITDTVAFVQLANGTVYTTRKKVDTEQVDEADMSKEELAKHRANKN